MCKENEGDVMMLPEEVLEATPGPFESEMLVPRNGIVKLQQHRPKGHGPNKLFHGTWPKQIVPLDNL